MAVFVFVFELGDNRIFQQAARRCACRQTVAPSIGIVRRIDALFAIERSINGKSVEERLAVRQASSRPLVDALESYMREQLAKLSRGHDLAKAMQYILKRWPAFTLFLDDGRICLSNNAAERYPSAVGRLFKIEGSVMLRS